LAAAVSVPTTRTNAETMAASTGMKRSFRIVSPFVV
jgi:hypothetical protein